MPFFCWFGTVINLLAHQIVVTVVWIASPMLGIDLCLLYFVSCFLLSLLLLAFVLLLLRGLSLSVTYQSIMRHICHMPAWCCNQFCFGVMDSPLHVKLFLTCLYLDDIWRQLQIGLHQGCPLPLILLVVFMDRISEDSHGKEGVRFGNLCFF